MRRLLSAGLVTGLLSSGALLMGPVVAHSATTTTVDPLKAGATNSSNTLVVPQSPGYALHKLNPFYSAAYCYAGDISVQQTMYRPAYYFGLGKSIAVQPLLSAANMPTYSEAGGVTTVTITEKPWLWTDANTKTYTSNGDGTTTLSATDYHSQVSTARDIVFWLNMDKAMSKGNFYQAAAYKGNNGLRSNPAYAACGFVPGMGLPDQVDTVTAPQGLNGDTVVIKFLSHQNHDWLLANELSQIQPMPAAWDTAYATVSDSNQWLTPYSGSARTCAGESWSSIKTDGTDLCSYTYGYLKSLLLTDSLWHWSNGPYRIGDVGYSSGATDGNQFIVANTHYSGPVAAKAVKKVVWLPETDTNAEIAQLRAGQLTSGYVTPDLVTASPGIGKAGANLDNTIANNYNTVGSTSWGVGFWQLNFGNVSSSTAPCVGQDGQTQAHNCTWAAMINQQYMRQAMFTALDQKSVIKTIMNGYGIPGWSAIPGAGGGAFSKGVAKPLSYNPTKAKALLTANGWATTTTVKKVNGVNTTVLLDNPTGGSDTVTCRWSVGSNAHPYGCGTQTWPIDNGTSASFDFIYPNGSPTTDAEVAAYSAYLQLVGIHLNVSSPDATTVGNTCFYGTADWQICWYGGWIYAPDYYPSGETLFGTGAGSNNFGYSNPIMDGLIAATSQSGSSALNDSISMANLGLGAGDAAAAGNPSNAAKSFVQWSAQDLPVLWMPWGTGFGERLKTITGAQPPNPLGDFNPEYITFIQ